MRRLSAPPLLRSNRSFRRFWTGQTISLFGDQISLLAIPLLAAIELDAGPEQMGLLGAAALAPNLLFSIHLGAWADRRPRRRPLLVAADLGRAALLLTIPLAALLGVLSLAQLYVVAFAAGSLGVVFSVAYDIVFVSLLERDDYIEGGSLLNASRALSIAGGSGAAGLLVQLLTAPLALLADAGSYLASAFFVGRARAPEPPAEASPEGPSLAAGARFISRDPTAGGRGRRDRLGFRDRRHRLHPRRACDQPPQRPARPRPLPDRRLRPHARTVAAGPARCVRAAAGAGPDRCR